MTKKNERLLSNGRTPSAEWRGKPLWSGNGCLDGDELIHQIHILKEMGMGGFFMHSRIGLATEYLGDEWFELVNACTEETATHGMESWLYDEDKWPSGTAAGMVTARPEYRMKFIYLERFDGESFDFNSWWKATQHPLGCWSSRSKGPGSTLRGQFRHQIAGNQADNLFQYGKLMFGRLHDGTPVLMSCKTTEHAA